MSGFLNKYPYTDFHELNLDWLLEHYSDLVNQLNEINTWISQHKIDYETAIAELNRISNEIDTFEAQVNIEFEKLKTDLENEVDDKLNSITVQVDAKIRQLENEVNAAISGFETEFENLRLQILAEFAQFKAQINYEIIQLRNSIDANNDFVFAWVENRLQEFIDSLPEILTVMVYNPYRGYDTDIQTAINDIYSYAAVWSLTAIQYDSLGLTAEEYDVLGLTAIEYDTMAYKLLYKDPNDYMISPFTGQLVTVKEVVTKLCYFHMEGLTAEEYDLKDLTAQDYDDLELSAFDYDWFGEQLIA